MFRPPAPRKSTPSTGVFRDTKTANRPPTGPNVQLPSTPDDGDYGQDDYARAHVSEHDERGNRDTLVGPGLMDEGDPQRPPVKPGASTRIATGQMLLTAPTGGVASTVGIAITPSKLEDTRGQVAVTLWKNTAADVLMIGNGPNQCFTPMPSVPLRLETSATIYARWVSGGDGTLAFVLEYK